MLPIPSRKALRSTSRATKDDPVTKEKVKAAQGEQERLNGQSDATKDDAKPKAQNIPHICSHCNTKVSPIWKAVDEHGLLCNACSLYLKFNGMMRPLSDLVVHKAGELNSSKLKALDPIDPETKRNGLRDTKRRNRTPNLNFQTESRVQPTTRLTNHDLF